MENNRCCKTCNKTKPLEDFKPTGAKNKHGISYGYREFSCRDCSNTKAREYWVKRLSGITSRICSKCELEKSIDNFNKGRTECKECSKKYKESVKEQTKLQKQQYYLDNKEHILNRCKEYEKRNVEKVKIRKKKYRDSHKNEYRKYMETYKVNNREKRRNYDNNKLKIDINYKVKRNLRGRIWSALKGLCKSKSTIELLGCSLEEFKQYLQLKFQLGMTWDNYGSNGWHIDHIKPCDSFNLTNLEQQKQCFHYSNLQPLWATKQIAEKYGCFDCITNLEKSNKIL